VRQCTALHKNLELNLQSKILKYPPLLSRVMPANPVYRDLMNSFFFGYRFYFSFGFSW